MPYLPTSLPYHTHTCTNPHRAGQGDTKTLTASLELMMTCRYGSHVSSTARVRPAMRDYTAPASYQTIHLLVLTLVLLLLCIFLLSWVLLRKGAGLV